MPHAGEDPLSYWGLVLLCDIVLLKTTRMCRCMGALPKRLKLRAPDECHRGAGTRHVGGVVAFREGARNSEAGSNHVVQYSSH